MMAYYLVLLSSSIILTFKTFSCRENDMTIQIRSPDSNEGGTSMALLNNTEQDKEDMRSFNQLMEKAGMLTDDEFFGSL